jgi:hypothetical protein
MVDVTIEDPEVHDEKKVTSGGRVYVGRAYDGRELTIVAEFANSAIEDIEAAIEANRPKHVDSIIGGLNGDQCQTVAGHYDVDLTEDGPVFMHREELQTALVARAEATTEEHAEPAD